MTYIGDTVNCSTPPLLTIELLHRGLEVGAGLEFDESENGGLSAVCPLLHEDQSSLTLCHRGHVLFPYTRHLAVQNCGQSLLDPAERY